MNEITDYTNDGEEPDTLYAMFEEDERRLKFFYPSVFLIEMAMNRRAKNWRFKIKIASVEYLTNNQYD